MAKEGLAIELEKKVEFVEPELIKKNTNRNGSKIFSLIRKSIVKGGIKAALPLFPKIPVKYQGSLIDIARNKYLSKIQESGKKYGWSPEQVERKLQSCSSFSNVIKQTLPELNNQTRLKLIENLFYRQTLERTEIAEQYEKKHGELPPQFLLMSPSMNCNLKCQGCWAEHQKGITIPEKKVNEILNEAKKEMGIHFIVLTGGEPTMLPYLYNMLEEHNDIAFMPYTNGTLINDQMADKIAELGNFYPCFSLSGDKQATEYFRGKGVYDKVMDAMARLKDRGVFFGISAVHTKQNHDSVVNEQYFDELIERGARIGWLFQYTAVGRNPNPEIIPTPEQRIQRYDLLKKIRQDKKQMALYDFWNDGGITGGCIGWGKIYAHINANAELEPCAFIPFSKDNLYDKTLTECMTADWLKDARTKQPFNKNLLAPCPYVDNPETLKNIVEKHNVHGSYKGAEQCVSGPIYEAVCENARNYKECLVNFGLEERL